MLCAYYDKIAEGYEELHKNEQIQKIRLISDHLKIDKNDLLLDVGCGTGLTTRFWSCRRIGLDPAIRLLKKTDKKGYVNAEAENIPFKDNVFDIVISVTAIQNFHNIKKGLEEIKRVGKNRFALSFLKKSSKKENIRNLIEEIFDVKKVIEEEKDLIYFIG
jgi:ubiquinone/menaquinone biosynthesis C-methylase UbiE